MTPNDGRDDATATPGGGDFVSASAYSVAELRTAVFGDPAGAPDGPAERDPDAAVDLDPLVAISLLAHKEYDGKREDLRAVLVDETRDPRLRQNAASALGRVGGTEAEADLLEALDGVETPEVQRGLLRALAEVGGERTLAAIRKRRGTFPELLERQAEWTETLIAFRTRTDPGSDVGRLPEQDLLSVTGETVEIGASVADDALGDPALASIQRVPDRPPVAVTPAAMYELDCPTQTLLVAFEETFLDAAAQPLEANHLAAVVLEHDDVESGEWTPRYYLLVQPDAPATEDSETDGDRGGRGGELFVTTTGGRIQYGGRFEPEEGGLAFELRAVEGAGVPAVRIEGRLLEGELAIEAAVASTQTPEAKQPSPASPDEPASRD